MFAKTTTKLKCARTARNIVNSLKKSSYRIMGTLDRHLPLGPRLLQLDGGVEPRDPDDGVGVVRDAGGFGHVWLRKLNVLVDWINLMVAVGEYHSGLVLRFIAVPAFAHPNGRLYAVFKYQHSQVPSSPPDADAVLPIQPRHGFLGYDRHLLSVVFKSTRDPHFGKRNLVGPAGAPFENALAAGKKGWAAWLRHEIELGTINRASGTDG
ncbi:hypothetical protein PspLS_10487 [Pyricularia sp. CBS 133598]|nr:hypothetical protein PspLS_10487 [Pyricularia sp. CBS 133598]